MFAKPKQRNLRGRLDADNTEDDPSALSNIPAAPVQQSSVTIKPAVPKPTVPKSLLSFGDDEGNVFMNKLFSKIILFVNR